MVAVASTVADLVVSVSHHTSANWASLLPISENDCPVQIVKNRVFQLVPVERGVSMFNIPKSYQGLLHLTRYSSLVRNKNGLGDPAQLPSPNPLPIVAALLEEIPRRHSDI